jgi:pyrroline-5-carboxylate reductase
MGGPAVTRALIDNLLEQGRRRNVEILVVPLRQEDHSGFEGPKYLAETQDNKWVGYVEAQETSVLITDPKSVSAMLQRYGKMRSQALSQTATASLLEQMRGAL